MYFILDNIQQFERKIFMQYPVDKKMLTAN